MKRVIALVLMAFVTVAFALPCNAAIERGRTYLVTLTSGTTTDAPNTGASVMQIANMTPSGATDTPWISEVQGNAKTGGNSGTTTLKAVDMLPGVWTVQADQTEGGVTITQWHVGDGGSNDNVQWDLFVKFSMIDNETYWTAAEEFPVVLGETLASATSPMPRTFTVPQAMRFARWYTRPSGATPLGTVKYILQMSSAPPPGEFQPVGPLSITGGTTEYVMNANSGVSSLTVPDGTTSAAIAIKGDDIVYTVDGTSPAANDGPVLTEGKILLLDSKWQARLLRARVKDGGSGTTLYPFYYRDNQ